MVHVHLVLSVDLSIPLKDIILSCDKSPLDAQYWYLFQNMQGPLNFNIHLNWSAEQANSINLKHSK